MPNYFDNFSIAQYNNQFCRAITSRAALSQTTLRNFSAYYPYQLRHAERPDVLAHTYYNDSALEWLVFFANGVTDPYYEWYLTDEQMTAYLASKYGSLAAAQQKTRHFEVSWAGDSTQLDPTSYSNLASNIKQYWSPFVDDFDTPVYYQRKPMDLMVATNKVISLGVSSSAGYTLGEIVYQINPTSGAISFSAEIDFKGDNYILVKHVYGTYVVSPNTYALMGQESGNAQWVTSGSTIQQNIPTSEEAYWTGVSFYDYEMFLNEQRKVIRVVDRAYSETARTSLKQVMGT